MNAHDILKNLKLLGKESYRRVLIQNHGVKEPCFGVAISELKKIQKRIKRDYQLALDLYNTGNYDAMYLAGLIADDARMTTRDLQRWVDNAYAAALPGTTVASVAAGSPHGWELGLQWIDSPKPLTAVAGWATISSILSIKPDAELDLDELKQLIKRARNEIAKAPDVVRYQMNAFIIAAGSYVESLTALAIETAEKIGPVMADLGNNHCQVPFAPDYIRKVQARGSIGKKRKSASAETPLVANKHCQFSDSFEDLPEMLKRKVTLGHSPDPDDAFMFYALAKELIPSGEYEFDHILQDIQTLNERATRGELDVSAISIHAYAYVSDQYALLPSGASMGDGYGPMLVAKQKFSKDEILKKRIAIPGKMTSAFLALQLWLQKKASELDLIVVPFDQIFGAVRDGRADVGLIIHEGQLTYQDQGLELCEDLGVWWGQIQDGLPLPLGGNVIHKRFSPADRKKISDLLTTSIQFSLDHRPDAVKHALQFARDMGVDLADKFVGMYVNHWTLDYGERGRESIRRFLNLAHERGLIPHKQELEFVR